MPRYEFIDELIKEKDIHPDEIFANEKQMAHDFIERQDKCGENEYAICPICNTHLNEVMFEKWGQKYFLCSDDWTVVLGKTFDDSIVQNYFNLSELALYRSTKEYQKIAINHRSELWEALIEWIDGRVCRYLGQNKYNVIDCGSKYTGWTQKIMKSDFIRNIKFIDTLPPVLGEVIDNKITESKADVICAIDIMQRIRNPKAYIQKLKGLLKEEGLLIITTRAGSGLDILTLREKSETIFPLDHIFLPSPKSISDLLEDQGFEVLEISTPGLFDVEFLKKEREKIPTNQYFQRYIMQQNNERFLERIQVFLQQNNLSSYIRVVAKKKEEEKCH